MKKSTFCKALLVLALALAIAVPVCAWSGSGTSSSPYQISSVDDLKKVKDYPGAYFKQTANITLNDPSLFVFKDGVIIGDDGAEVWTPIENFTGTYDGGSKYITGLYVCQDSANGGLFANINGGTVKNVYLDLALVESDEYAGILAGKIEGASSVTNCMTSGSVIGKTTKSMNTAGGLAGLIGKYANVSDSISYATVSGATSYSANVGGLAGVNHGTISECGYYGNVFGTATYYDASIGGIAGYNTGNIDNCLVAGAIGGESTALVNDCYVGGVVGVNKGYIEYCQNDAAVSVVNCTADHNANLCAAGGIAGATFDADISYNTNNGKISGEYSYNGGIAGVAVSDTGTHYVDYNDNTGAVSSAHGVAGGIVGRAVAAGEGYVSTKLYVDDCYNSGSVSGSSKTGNIAGETAVVESAIVSAVASNYTNDNGCSARTIYAIDAELVQYSGIPSGSAVKVSGSVTLASAPKVRGASTANSNKKILRVTDQSGVFTLNSLYVELVSVNAPGKPEAYDLDLSGIKYENGKITGDVVVKVYRPENDTTEYTVVVGVSSGNKFVSANFGTVKGSDRMTNVTVHVDCVAPEGTITVNALVVDTTSNMAPVGLNEKKEK